jgi:hypothetical protein
MTFLFKYTNIIYQEKDMKKSRKKLSECISIPQKKQKLNSLNFFNYNTTGGNND